MCTPRGLCDNTLLRRLLRRFSRLLSRRALRGFFQGVLERGHLEAGTLLLGEYDPLRVLPRYAWSAEAVNGS